MLNITLMNHSFEIPCEPEERERLIEAATLVEDRLEQATGLRAEGKILMVALNLAYEHLQMKDETMQYSLHLENQVDSVIKDLTKES